MNKHQIQGKYSTSDYDEIMKDPDYENAFLNTHLFGKGDFCLIIAPPETEEFTLLTAISTVSKLVRHRVGGLQVPTLNRVLYIDTISTKEKLRADLGLAESFLGRKASSKFRLITDQDLLDFSGELLVDDLDRECEMNLIKNHIEDHGTKVDGIFVMLNSVIFSTNNFVKSNFDRFLVWAKAMKKLGKTVVVISHYPIAAISYLTMHMDCVFQCIPDQRSISAGATAFGVQYLKHSDTSGNQDLNRQLEKGYQTQFAMIAYFDDKPEKARRWIRSPCILCNSSYQTNSVQR